MLTIKEIRAHSKSNEERHEPGQHVRGNSKIYVDENACCKMNDQCNQRVAMLAWALNQRFYIQPVNEQSKISHDDRQWVTVNEIGHFFFFRQRVVLLGTDRRIRTDSLDREFRIVCVVMIVRAFPDILRSQNKYSKSFHDQFSGLRSLEDRVMLIVMIDGKHPYIKQCKEQRVYRFQHPDHRKKSDDETYA